MTKLTEIEHPAATADATNAPANQPPAASPPRRVFIVNRYFHPDLSATSQLASDLAFDLARRGHSVCAIASQLLYDEQHLRLPRTDRVNGVDIKRLATTGAGRGGLVVRALNFLTFYLSALVALLHRLRPGDIVVLKTDPPLLSVALTATARLKGAVVVNWLQDIYPEVATALGIRPLEGPAGAVIRAMRNHSLRTASFNVVLGERMAAFVGEAGVAPHRIRIIHNWCDEQAITPMCRDTNPLRREWRLTGKFVVGYSGNLGRAHDYETMFGAAKLLSNDPRIVFVVIGGGHGANGLKDAIAAAGLGNVVFQPYQPQASLAASLSAADVHWLSLRPELEALIVPSKVYGILASGRPLISVTDANGEISRLVRQHACGVQVDPGDCAAFARAVRTLASDHALAAAYGEAARRASITTFSRERALLAWRSVLESAGAQANVQA